MGPLALSTEEIRQTLIADNRKHFDATDEAWLETLIMRVERWKANGAHERVVLITTCVMVFGVYHDRAI